MAAASRSRSRPRRGGRRESDRSRRDRRDMRPSPTRKGRPQGRPQGRKPDPPPEPEEAAAKTGKDKAKEAMVKEREKARLKKLERETAQKDKEQQRQELRNQKRQEEALALLESVDASAKAAKNGAGRRGGSSLHIPAQSEAEQRAEAARARPLRPEAKSDEDADEASIRKLFDLLDRSSKGQVSQKDVLMALRKHHPLRQLFGLASSGGSSDEAAQLQERLGRIQESFEAGSGLGEVSPIFLSLKEASDCGNAFSWEPFLAACQRGELHKCVKVAVNSLPREHSQGEAFVASREWQVVPQGAACPAGLEFRMDMDTGQTMARLPQKKQG